MKTSNTRKGRVTLGAVSGTTLGGIRGVIEPFGLYTPASKLD
jgi:hypothetical protein